MLTVKECRKILDNEAEGLSDEEVIAIRDWLSNMADILIDSLESEVQIKQENDEKRRKS